MWTENYTLLVDAAIVVPAIVVRRLRSTFFFFSSNSSLFFISESLAPFFVQVRSGRSNRSVLVVRWSIDPVSSYRSKDRNQDFYIISRRRNRSIDRTQLFFFLSSRRILLINRASGNFASSFFALFFFFLDDVLGLGLVLCCFIETLALTAAFLVQDLVLAPTLVEDFV